MQKYIVEFIGTFFLVFVVGNVVLNGEAIGVLGPLAIASALMVMVFAGGHISGAHYNPAVTLGVTMRGKCSVADAIPYIVAQVAGAIVAALAAVFITGGSFVPADAMIPLTAAAAEGTSALMPRACLAEFIGTFALVYVVLNVATAEGTSGNSFYGLAIGFTVLVGAISLGGISGGAFNPAVAVGLGVLKKAAWPDIWVYLAPDFAAAALAAIVFRITNGEDSE